MANLPVPLAMAPKFFEERLISNLDYESSGSTTKCVQVIEDCDVLISQRPQRLQSGGPSGEGLQFDYNSLVAIRDRAEKYKRRQNAKTYYQSHNIGHVNMEHIQE